MAGMARPQGHLTRRHFLGLSAAGGLYAAMPKVARAQSGVVEYRLTATPGKARLIKPDIPETDLWTFSGTVPGPLLRLKQGERLRVLVENRLSEATTVHWHGIRLPNNMDGVPHVTQPPIEPGQTFTYEFDVPDAGTYWYHPHLRSFEQVDRGLAGPLIIDEPDPIRVDRDIVWVLDDWRLDKNAQITDDFAHPHDMSHAGRIGNTVTINGLVPENFAIRAGERIRLRLINVANARAFRLKFEGHKPTIVALDGHPVKPHAAPGGRVTLGAAMRADIVLDASGKPGETFQVVDDYYGEGAYRLVRLAYSDERPLRESPLDAPVALAANPLPEPKLENAEKHFVTLEGGMMGSLKNATMDGRQVDLREMMHNGKAWIINGVVSTGHVMDPMLTLERGKSYILDIRNHTRFAHPMHIHGHAYRVITRNGLPTTHREWLDTVLLERGEAAEVAFVADNPGDWMFHCHILEHQMGGMMGIIRVT